MAKKSDKSPGIEQLSQWTGEFGDAYTERNAATEERIRQRVMAYSQILSHLRDDPPASILECGANIGLNLRALKHITGADLFAVEPNAGAVNTLIEDGVVSAERVKQTTVNSIPFENGSMDLVFTSTVLIHVPDDVLNASLDELYRVSGNYLLCIEYFSPQPVTITYRGHDDLLFKRDYGGLWMDRFPDLRLIADGFFWKRTTGLDDVNWWLFRKG